MQHVPGGWGRGGREAGWGVCESVRHIWCVLMPWAGPGVPPLLTAGSIADVGQQEPLESCAEGHFIYLFIFNI